MEKLKSLKMGIFSFLAISFLFLGSTDLFAQPTVESIKRYSPSDEYTYDYDLYWIVTFSDPIEGKTISIDDFTIKELEGADVYYEIDDVYQNDKSGYEWIVYAYTETYSESAEYRLDFTGYVTNTKGTGTSKGYSYTKGETFHYGEQKSVVPEVNFIQRYNPSQQYNLAGNLTWYVNFTNPIDKSTLSTSDFTLTTTSGNATGTISSIDAIGEQDYLVNITNVSGTGNLRLDFTGTVTGTEGDDSKNKFTYGDIYIIQPPVKAIASDRFSPAGQITKLNAATWKVTFDRPLNASSVSTSDFKLSAVSGTLSGSISSVSGSGAVWNVNVVGVNKDATLKVDFTGAVTDQYNLPSSGTFTSGQTYIFDYTAPKLNSVSIFTNNIDPTVANPENNATVTFVTNETMNILSASINGKPVVGSGSGTTAGNAKYTFSKADDEGPITFNITISDIAGNTTTFTQTTDGSFANFIIPPPVALIITQPSDVIACEGSLDQYLFVVAAPDQKGLSIAYRWWKDGRPISDWVADFGQITFDTLKYDMSGTYIAQIFVFDPEYDEGPFSFEAARLSEPIFSAPANLYVLQRPAFMKPMANVSAKIGSSVSITFDANVYGEHNMEDPTYWTQIQWFKGDEMLTDNARYLGTKSSILSIVDVQATDYASDYKVRLIGECDTIYSNNFAINDEPNAIISIQPINVEGCTNTTVQLTVEAQSTMANANLNYQWMVNGLPIVNMPGQINGVNTPNLNVTLDPALNYDGTEQYTCHIWPVGYPANGVTSDPAMINWKSAPTISMDLSATYSAKVDDALTLYITANGDNLSYIWTKDGNDLGNDNDSLTIAQVVLGDAGDYVVTVSNDCGEVTSTTANLTVTQGPIITGVDVQSGYGLHQNYPNPFSVNSTISWNSERSGNAVMTLSDMLGNRVATLFDGYVNAGELKEVRLNANTLNLSTGTYYVTFTMGDKVQTKQISVVR